MTQSGMACETSLQRSRQIHLFDTECFGVPVEHDVLTCNETDFQPGPRPIVVASQDVINEQCASYGRKVIPTAHQFRAQPTGTCATSPLRN